MPDKEIKKETWGVEQVATQTEPTIYNAKEEKTYTIEEALCLVLKKVEEIAKNIGE